MYKRIVYLEMVAVGGALCWEPISNFVNLEFKIGLVILLVVGLSLVGFGAYFTLKNLPCIKETTNGRNHCNNEYKTNE